MMLSLLLFAIVTAPCVVIAQNQTFINGFLAKLSNMNLTVLAATMERVNIEPSEVQFFLTISDMTTTKTFFAPTNDASEDAQ
jgi:hypothetical protein